MGKKNFGSAERHDNEHGLGFALGDEIVEDDVGTADGGPGAGVIAEAVEQVEDGIGLLAARVVAGRSVNEKVAIVADHAGPVEMMMDFAVRDVVDFPRERRRARDVQFAGAVEKVGLDRVVGRIEESDAIGDDGVAVIIGSERVGGEGPDALIVLLHGEGLGNAFKGDGGFFDVGSAEAEGDAIVGMDFGGDQRGWRRLRERRGGDEKNCEREEEGFAFHEAPGRGGFVFERKFCAARGGDDNTDRAGRGPSTVLRINKPRPSAGSTRAKMPGSPRKERVEAPQTGAKPGATRR